MYLVSVAFWPLKRVAVNGQMFFRGGSLKTFEMDQLVTSQDFFKSFI